MKTNKYIPFTPVNLPDRQWPSKTITKAPVWCSVDLRDGNQALIDPMNLEEKLEMFQMLVDIGIKESGLVHLSQLADRYIKHPSEVVSIHQQVRVKVVGIDHERKRIALSMKTHH